MKILYNICPSAFQTKGGGGVQLLKTMQYLKTYKDINIRLFKLDYDIKKFDIFHNFSLHRDTAEIFLLAKYFGLKTVLSPIYWNNELLLKEEVNKYKSFAFNIIKKTLGNYMPLTLGWEKEMIKNADIIAPNSEIEKDVIVNRFGAERNKVEVVYNGVDISFSKGNPNLFRKKYNIYDDFILFVGRLEPRKNLIRLIKAVSGLNVKLVIVGPVYRNEVYYQKCKSISNKNIIFLGPIPHNSPLLRSAYSAAKVFVLPSIFETPGLSALEAGLSGANVVITKYGSTTEYFGKYGWYVDPFSVDNIKDNIIDAFKAKKNKKLSNYIKRRFTWDKVVSKLREIYINLQ